MKKSQRRTHPATSSARLRPEDWQLIERLQAKTGLSSKTEILRLALRALAQKEGLQ